MNFNDLKKQSDLLAVLSRNAVDEDFLLKRYKVDLVSYVFHDGLDDNCIRLVNKAVSDTVGIFSKITDKNISFSVINSKNTNINSLPLGMHYFFDFRTSDDVLHKGSTINMALSSTTSLYNQVFASVITAHELLHTLFRNNKDEITQEFLGYALSAKLSGKSETLKYINYLIDYVGHGIESYSHERMPSLKSQQEALNSDKYLVHLENVIAAVSSKNGKNWVNSLNGSSPEEFVLR